MVNETTKAGPGSGVRPDTNDPKKTLPLPPQLARIQLIPFLILLAIAVILGMLFYQVMRSMAMPLFLAAVTAMLCQPLQKRLTDATGNRPSMASGLLVLALCLAALAPIAYGMLVAAVELPKAIEAVRRSMPSANVAAWKDPEQNRLLGPLLARFDALTPATLEQVHEWALQAVASSGRYLSDRTLAFLSNVPSFLMALFTFLFALFYLLVDGPRLAAAWGNVTPLDQAHDKQLRQQFARVCRGVVWATIAAALAQGLSLVIGVALIEGLLTRAGGTGVGSWLLVIALLGVICSMVPLVGSAIVWAPIVIYWLAAGHFLAALALLVFGMAIIGNIDNLVKMAVLKGAADMHPLLVFVSVFGGIEYFGFIGVFIGPVLAAVLVVALRILKDQWFLFAPRTIGPDPAAA